jgi:hypothetical protein
MQIGVMMGHDDRQLPEAIPIFRTLCSHVLSCRLMRNRAPSYAPG